jgi:Cu(I)/Ag(I) efflux system membrane fusion protein
MKRKLKNKLIRSLFLLITLLSVSFTACKKENKHHDVYTCPMHPTVLKDKPGTCPVCGMDLVLKSEQIHGNTANLPSLDESSSVKTIKIIKKTIPVSIKAQGFVTYDLRNLYAVATRFSGRLEKVYVKNVYQKISKGDKLASIYSAELVAAQQELLYLMKTEKENTSLINAATQKLILLGLPRDKIAQVISKGKIDNEIPIHSQHDGFIVSDDQVAPTNSKSINNTVEEMGNKSSVAESATNAGNSILREGNYVRAGQTLYKIIDASTLRIELDLPLQQAATIKTGDNVLLEIKSKTHEANVDFVQPYLNNNQNFIKIRLYTKDLRNLLIGVLVRATLTASPIDGYWLPKSAVINLGLDNIALIKKNGLFKPMKIITGYADDEFINVKGLSENDSIACDARYMIDSESFIKTSE